MLKIALIGDVVGSRKSESRDDLQKHLIAAVKSLSRHPNPARQAEFTLSRGEEIEAVYSNGDGLIHDCWRLFAAFFPHRLRIALGVGPLTTGQRSTNPLLADGGAFHAARRLLIGMKIQNLWVRLAADADLDFDEENDDLDLISDRMQTWKRNRWKVFEAVRHDLGADAIAERVRIGVGGVYKNVRDGRLPTVHSVTDRIERNISRKMGQ